MHSGEQAPVPGTDDKVLAAVAGNLPSIPSPNLDEPERFAQAARRLVETRAQSGWPNEAAEGFAAFVLVEMPRRFDQKFSTSPVVDPLFTSSSLLGRLFFMNRDCSAGRSIEMPCSQSELLDWLVKHELENNPLAVAYPEAKKMTFRLKGVDDAAQDYSIREKPPGATQEELLEALEHFHLKKTLTPSCCVRGVWEPKRERQYVPGSEPERSIQKGLEMALTFWFHGVIRAEVEDSTNIGRIDVRLLKSSSDDTGLTYWAIIELKVIKSFRNATGKKKASEVSQSDNVKSIIEGINQAFAYSKNREAELGLLEVFDLRKNKCKDLCSDKDVISLLTCMCPQPLINTRPVFGSASDARKGGYTGD